jgi:hypothetical protein
MFSIIGFLSLFIAIFYNKSVANLYIWPISIIIFSSLFFASYNLQTSTTIVASENVTLINATNSYTTYQYDKDTTYFTEPAFSWMFVGLSLLSSILFIWDIWSKRDSK